VAHPFFEFSEKMSKIGKSSKNSGQPVVKYPPFCQKTKKRGWLRKQWPTQLLTCSDHSKKRKKAKKSGQKQHLTLICPRIQFFFQKKLYFRLKKRFKRAKYIP